MNMHTSPEQTTKPWRFPETVWLWLCVISFGCYLAGSEAVPAAVREVVRLCEKI